MHGVNPESVVSAVPGTPRESTARRADIQGLRAVAVALVVLFHAQLPVSGGFVGVDVFFVISGFVITAMLLRQFQADGRVRFGTFYLRRFKRLTPALAVTVAVTLLLSAFVLSPFGIQQDAALTGAGAMALVANFVIAFSSGDYFNAAAESNPLLNTWSLSVEEQFYLIFPAFLALMWWFGRRLGRSWMASGGILLIGVASFALAVYGSSTNPPGVLGILTGFYSPLTRVWEFAVGALLALLWDRLPLLRVATATSLAVAGVIGLVVSAFSISSTTPFPGPWTLVPVLSTAALIAAGVNQDNPISRALSIRSMVGIGDASYSIYLWHWPVIVLFVTIWPFAGPWVASVAALVSLGPALLSYRYVEQPFRLRQTHGRGEVAALIVGFVGVPVLIAGVVYVGAQRQWFVTWDYASGEAGQAQHVAKRECTDRLFSVENCTWNPAGSAGSVLLVGDSQSYALADAVVAAGEKLDMSVTVSARSGCPFLAADTTGSKPLDCVAWQREMLDYVAAEQPTTVIIANRSTGYTNPDLGWRRLVKAGEVVPEAQTVTAYRQSLESVVSDVNAAGSAVIIVSNVPEPEPAALQPSLLNRALDRNTPATFDARHTLEQRSSASNVEQGLVSASNGPVVVVDPASVLCEDSQCQLALAGVPLYLDSSHLTRQGALELSDALTAGIQAAGSAAP